MRFSFAKYQGLGNDFIVLDARQWPEDKVGPELAKQLCDRHRSIGGDGILWVELTKSGAVRMVIYNRDGSRPEMCGNGVRCVAAYFADRDEVKLGDPLEVLSDAGPRPVTLGGVGFDGSWFVTVDMGSIVADTQGFATAELDGTPTLVRFADAGNPHAVLFVEGEHASDEIEDDSPQRVASREATAALVRAHRDRYPHGTNVEFVAQKQDRSLRVRVHERGVGWTLACGTGACAVAAVATAVRGERDATQIVDLDGGRLSIRVVAEQGGAYHAWMTGPARRAFRGSLEESELPR
ncbi:MAG: diaminopimelate epimerase [Myxococcales bacterium]|nr:diaminopimelate epimerase [Myxococcales bacterium]